MSSVVVRREGELWWVGLNRPDRRNAHDEAMVTEFDAVLAQARRTPSILLVHSTTPGTAKGANLFNVDVENLDDNSYDMSMDTKPGSATSDLALSTIEPHDFRQVLGQFLTGVAVISAMDGEEPVGLTVGSFFSVSLDPPLVGFCAAHSSKTWPVIRRSGRFCVNVLAADQEGVCRSFARTGADKFSGVDWALSDGGCPRINDVIAWIDCDIEVIHGAGDHEICVGRVRGLGAPRASVPLPFFRGRHQIR